jgi:3-phosphoshikimate 1-carboxyvinyltransferase
MSEYKVKKLDKPIDWTVDVPGSKSMTNRALLMAALSNGEVTLDGVAFSDDSKYFLSSLESLGFKVESDEANKRIIITGEGGQIPNKNATINVGSAGTAARFLTAMAAFSDGEYVIEASEQMKKRPMRPLFALLESVGANITYLENEGFLPVRITGCNKNIASLAAQEHPDEPGHNAISQHLEESSGTSDGAIQPLALDLDISESTQFLSAILLVSPMIKQGVHIHITSEKTDGSYIRITTKMMKEAGVNVAYDGKDYEVAPDSSYDKAHYRIEPDVSAACYFYAAAAVTGGRALVNNVFPDNSQGDMKFIDLLRKMGCTISCEEAGIAVTGPPVGHLMAMIVNMNDFSDQALTLAAIAPYTDSAVMINGIGHIRGQECDRLHAMATELARAGIDCDEWTDSIIIYPGDPKPCTIETYNDHRVAMAFSLLGLRTDGIVIDNPDCCKKTFGEYFEILDRLCGADDK